MKEENLTKENFWNGIKEKYPKASKEFCDWVDAYKEENNWDSLFNSDYVPAFQEPTCPAPKYHDLPIAMQFGIFVQFVFDMRDKYLERLSAINVFVYRSFNSGLFQNVIIEVFIDLEKVLSNQSSILNKAKQNK